MLREDRRFFLWTTLAGLALRLFFFIYFPSVTDDSRVYLDLAKNWAEHGIYGQTESGQIVPVDTRLPGYPAFLAPFSAIFGAGNGMASANVRAILIAQIALDLFTCLLIADLARRTLSNRRAAKAAFLLAAMCPFLANYAAAVLSETLETFFTVLALDCAAAALDRMHNAGNSTRGSLLFAATGASIGACILLRPDGGILLMSVAFYIAFAALSSLRKDHTAHQGTHQSRSKQFRRLLLAELIIAVFALAPLVPWTMRNFRALHHFQPLAPRYANESDETAPHGFNRWVKTWIADYASVEEVYWNVPGDKIDPKKLPARALDTSQEKTLALIDDYNQSQDLTSQLDARFAEVAAERIRAHPIRYYVELPLLRIADMWLRPRTELLPPDIRWWEFNDDTEESIFAIALGMVNLGYVVAALFALSRRHSQIRYLGLLVSFLVLRTAFLGTIENPEPRYTLECYSVLIVLAAAIFARKQASSLSLAD
jgi:hypothetical protein